MFSVWCNIFSVLQNAPFVVGARLVRYYVCNLFLGNLEIVQKVMRNSEAVMKCLSCEGH